MKKKPSAPRAPKLPPQPEWRLQIQVCDYLRVAYPDLLWWSCPNGGFILDQRIVAKLKATGLRPGVPDLAFLLEGGRVGFIEMKTATGRVSDDQKAFMAAAFERGAGVAVCRSLDDVVSTLTKWGVKGRILV